VVHRDGRLDRHVLEVLDTSIAHVALRYIAGGLSAEQNDSEWVITSYLAANAAVLWLVMFGALMMAAGAYWFTQLNLDDSPDQLVWPRMVQRMGTSFMFAPLSVAVFMYLPRELRGAVAGNFAVLGNEGGAPARRWARPWYSAGYPCTPIAWVKR
jgi:hypothetical protein